MTVIDKIGANIITNKSLNTLGSNMADVQLAYYIDLSLPFIHSHSRSDGSSVGHS